MRGVGAHSRPTDGLEPQHVPSEMVGIDTPEAMTFVVGPYGGPASVASRVTTDIEIECGGSSPHLV